MYEVQHGSRQKSNSVATPADCSVGAQMPGADHTPNP